MSERRSLSLTIRVVACALAGASFSLPPSLPAQASDSKSKATFVGSELCQKCHAEIYAGWKRPSDRDLAGNGCQ